MVLLEFAMAPTGQGESMSAQVARILDVIDKSGVPYQLTPMGTILEGEWDDVMRVVTTCFKTLQADCHRIIAQSEHDRNGIVIRLGFRRPCRVHCVSHCEDECHAHSYEFGCQSWEPIVSALRPSVFNLYILTVYKSAFFQAFPKCIQEESGFCRKHGAQKSNDRHCALLGQCYHRPRRRTAEDT